METSDSNSCHTACLNPQPQDWSEACPFDPPPAVNSSWCCIPMAHTSLWASQSFPSCYSTGMGHSSGTCLWQASAFTLTLVSWGPLPGSQVTNANTHTHTCYLGHKLQKHTAHSNPNLLKREALKCDPNHLKSIGIIVREVLPSGVSQPDNITLLWFRLWLSAVNQSLPQRLLPAPLRSNHCFCIPLSLCNCWVVLLKRDNSCVTDKAEGGHPMSNGCKSW